MIQNTLCFKHFYLSLKANKHVLNCTRKFTTVLQFQIHLIHFLVLSQVLKKQILKFSIDQKIMIPKQIVKYFLTIYKY